MNFIEWITDYKFGVFNRHWWKDFYYNQISARLWPRQKWLTSKLPRTWVDKDSIMELCVLECLKNYVEEEMEVSWLMDVNRWKPEDNVHESQLQFEEELKIKYIELTSNLPILERKLEEEWETIPKWDLDECTRKDRPKDYYEKTYGKIDQLEKEIDDLRTEIMVWCVKNRGAMWT